MKKTSLLIVLLVWGIGADNMRADDSWRAVLAQQVPRLGHRNWIVIADSAYPAQSNPGITTVATGADQLEVVKATLKELQKAGHVRPIVQLDAELASFPGDLLPGMDSYRNKLEHLLKGAQVIQLPHEELIKKLDSAADLFNILILKTNLKLPYTSVFLMLDCAYWGEAADKTRLEALRKRK